MCLKERPTRRQGKGFVLVFMTWVLTWQVLKVILLNQIIRAASLSAGAELPPRCAPLSVGDLVQGLSPYLTRKSVSGADPTWSWALWLL